METEPAIIVIAYNRDACLQRLLSSLARANYPTNNITLVISIDKSDNNSVKEVAEQFNWPHGAKEVILHEQRLGLKKHVLSCGALSEKYGAVILLEDDLIVSPYFYSYATRALSYYSNDPLIAGISLYSYRVTENGFRPFFCVDDGKDMYYMQLPSSWGQAFTQVQWRTFNQWYSKNNNRAASNLPEHIQQWSQSSWKKHFVQYMIENNLFFVYPRVSLSTNFSEPGVNSVQRGLFQVELADAERSWTFNRFSESQSVYDCSFEIAPDSLKTLLPELSAYDFECDLYGTKNMEDVSRPYLLSSKQCSEPIATFGNDLISAVQNIRYRCAGSFYSLAPTQKFTSQTPELIDYYVSAKSIYPNLFHRLQQSESDKVAYEKTRASWKQWCDEFLAQFKLSTEFPNIEVIILANSSVKDTSDTINSIRKQSYPESQYHISVLAQSDELLEFKAGNTSVLLSKNKEDLLCNFRKVMGQQKENCYYVMVRSGDEFFDNSFKEVNGIFRRYPDVNWLTGIQTLRSANGFNVITGTTPMRRWNRHIFERNLYKNAGRSLSPGSTFWKKYLWDIAAPHVSLVSINSLFDDLWLAFFKVQELYTCDVYLSSTRNFNVERIPETQHTNTLVEDGLFNKLQEFLFVNNVPYLRAYYKSKNCLPPVVRYDHKSKSYFLSDY